MGNGHKELVSLNGDVDHNNNNFDDNNDDHNDNNNNNSNQQQHLEKTVDAKIQELADQQRSSFHLRVYQIIGWGLPTAGLVVSWLFGKVTANRASVFCFVDSDSYGGWWASGFFYSTFFVFF